MKQIQQYSAAEMERMMKVQDVLLKAMAKKITWWEAAEIIGVSDRTMRRWRERLERDGHGRLLSFLSRVRRGAPHSGHDPLVVGTAAQVSAQAIDDLCVRRLGVVLQQRYGLEHHARSAVAALHGAFVEERLLDRVQLPTLGEASMVTILRPSAARTVVTQETAGLPSRSTVHDPHWPSPQPYFVPVNPKSSRSTSSRGRSGSVSILSALPLTDNRIVAIETSYQFAPFLPAVACEGYPTVCESMIFCSGRRCSALASASRSTMARITVEKPSEAQ